ncbi:hypothetical protein ACG33_00835 [Steroidobacter denitrificans]|uniref:Uncharacterized protein n=1 Tax=Steroidobacter denitrificans TaxID=465721 RepID=A0A127F5G9_STEDE|nr:hypothetical protein [Steroidobacter denitrificans]AMN45673.1 hypothetical protein ACG33_00835 [Steroidobacter denitrificans]
MSSRRRFFLICTSVLLVPLTSTFDAIADSPDDPKPAEVLEAPQAPAPRTNAAPAATASAAPQESAPSAIPAQSDPDEDVDAGKAPESTLDGRTSPQRFVPSEQVRADFDVSFPIDI